MACRSHRDLRRGFESSHIPLSRHRDEGIAPETSSNVSHALIPGTVQLPPDAGATHRCPCLVVSLRLIHEASCHKAMFLPPACPKTVPMRILGQMRSWLCIAEMLRCICLGLLTATFVPPPRRERFRESGCNFLLHPCNESLRCAALPPHDASGRQSPTRAVHNTIDASRDRATLPLLPPSRISPTQIRARSDGFVFWGFCFNESSVQDGILLSRMQSSKARKRSQSVDVRAARARAVP